MGFWLTLLVVTCWLMCVDLPCANCCREGCADGCGSDIGEQVAASGATILHGLCDAKTSR
jgi:hypothetical protein